MAETQGEAEDRGYTISIKFQPPSITTPLDELDPTPLVVLEWTGGVKSPYYERLGEYTGFAFVEKDSPMADVFVRPVSASSRPFNDGKGLAFPFPGIQLKEGLEGQFIITLVIRAITAKQESVETGKFDLRSIEVKKELTEEDRKTIKAELKEAQQAAWFKRHNITFYHP